MTDNPRCGTCRWWDGDSGFNEIAECHGSPPVVDPNLTGGYRMFPRTRHSDWCAKHTAIPKPKQTRQTPGDLA